VNLKRVTQLRTNIARDVKGDLFVDFHSILNRQRNHFSQLLNVLGIDYVRRQTEIHTAEPILREPSAFGDEVTTEKLKRYRSPGTDQILAEMIKAGVGTIHSDIHKHINSVWRKRVCLSSAKNQSQCHKTDCSSYCGISVLSTTYKVLSNIHLSRLTPYAD
jgi:hypothetical protein